MLLLALVEQAGLRKRLPQLVPVLFAITVQAEEVGHGQVVHHEVQRLVALGFALDPLDPLVALHVAGDLAFGHALLEELVRQVLGEVQRARPLLEAVAVVDPVLGRVGTNDP